jgi:2-oxoglutarate dehydrogenase E2 component (dihydrolipoamide succinyltransferase)
VSTEIRLPQYGMTMHEATIVTWLKKVGDTIVEGEPIAELDTDKATVELPAPTSGTLSEIRVQAGETVEVLEVIALVD